MSAVGVHRVVERQVAALGDRIAVADAGGGLTYRELNQRANVVARRLMACGLRRAARVTLKIERSPQLAVLMFAVLKAGAAYMWIDLGASRASTADRIAFAGTRDLLAEQMTPDQLAEARQQAAEWKTAFDRRQAASAR